MPQAAASEHTVTVDNNAIFYLESGNRSPLLLLHGIGHSSTAWLRSIPELAVYHRVLALDFPGFGRSPAAASGSYDPAYFAEIITAFIDELKLDRVDAVGSSLGGLALMLAALERPRAFQKIVLVDPVGFTSSPRPPLESALLALIQLWLMLPRSNGVIRGGYAAAFFDPEKLDEPTVGEILQRAASPTAMLAARRTLHGIFQYSRRLDHLHSRLASLPVPVLLIWGKNDPVLPAADAAIAARVLPSVQVEILERCGHLPHIELPAEFCALALRFLGQA